MPTGVLAELSGTARLEANAAIDRDPMATFPRRMRRRAADGRLWELLTSRSGVAVMTEAGRLAEAHVADESDRVVVDFWADSTDLPADIGAQLVSQAFAHPAVRAHRQILVALPRGESNVLEQVRAHLDDAQARVAGVTCLVEGHVREGVPA